MKLLIKNGRVVDPSQNLDEVMDLLLEDGKIAKAGKKLNVSADRTYDAAGKVVAPGFILTDMTRQLGPDVMKQWEAKIPMRRGGTPEEVAKVCTFLASDLASYVSGQVILVDGGMGM